SHTDSNSHTNTNTDAHAYSNSNSDSDTNTDSDTDRMSDILHHRISKFELGNVVERDFRLPGRRNWPRHQGRCRGYRDQSRVG
ncbi:MAG: hypothetical protein ABIN83_07995, partial [Sphingomicrobium sp.]